MEVVYHAAAKVGDWGLWRQFQVDCIDATQNLSRAAAEARVGRFLHISSTSAYGHPPDQAEPIDETAPLGQNVWIWDPYTRSKVESERLLWRAVETTGLALTVIRPSWLYGERDRTTTVRLATRLRQGKVPIIGRGDNPMSAVYAGTVAEAAILAAGDPGSVGEAYNITNQGRITQAEFLNLFAAACGAPPGRAPRPLPRRLRGGVPPGSPRPLAPPRPAPAHQPVRHLADGPLPRLQHRQGRDPPRLVPLPLLPREHRSHPPLVSHATRRHPPAPATLRERIEIKK